MRSRMRSRSSGNIHVDMKLRRLARRANNGLRQLAEAPSSPAPEAPRQPSADILEERDLIAARITELKAELAEQEKHLKAIDLLLAVGEPPAEVKAPMLGKMRRPTDFVDVEFTVVR